MLEFALDFAKNTTLALGFTTASLFFPMPASSPTITDSPTTVASVETPITGTSEGNLLPLSFELKEIATDFQPAAPTSPAPVGSTQSRPEQSAPASAQPAVARTSLLPESYIQIDGSTIPLFTAPATFPDSGQQVGVYRGKFLYGHNTAGIFATLKDLPVGTPFTVRQNGQTHRYQIAYKITYKIGELRGQGGYATNLALNVYRANIHGQHDLALMTCAGTPLGGGDSTHRLVVMADLID